MTTFAHGPAVEQMRLPQGAMRLQPSESTRQAFWTFASHAVAAPGSHESVQGPPSECAAEPPVAAPPVPTVPPEDEAPVPPLPNTTPPPAPLAPPVPLAPPAWSVICVDAVSVFPHPT